MDKKNLLITALLGSMATMMLGALAAWLIKGNQQTPPIQNNSQYTQEQIVTKFSSKEAIQALKTKHTSLTITDNKAELIKYNGELAYEIKTSDGLYYVDANTANILAQPKSNSQYVAANQNFSWKNDDQHEYQEHHRKKRKHKEEHDDD